MRDLYIYYLRYGHVTALVLSQKQTIFELLLLVDETQKEIHLCLVAHEPMLLAERRLQYERDISEVRTVEDPPEALQPDGPLADVLVSVCVTAGRSLTVVDMTPQQPLPTNLGPELSDHSVKPFLAAQVVAGGHGVAGVQTDSDPLLVLHQVNDLPELPKISTNGVALARSDNTQYNQV